ncbi:MAG: lipase [Solirubrobacterales bacterium]
MLKKRWVAIALVVFLLTGLLVLPGAAPVQAAVRQNSYPIIFVHGFAGFARTAGINYWGGLADVPAYLRANGYEAYPVAVGPFSSNWDRACELYTEIKGGTVDYGAAHAAKYGHLRFGRTYPGLVPGWGQPDAGGQLKKVHLIAHSMGGQTSRVFLQLLEQGSTEELLYAAEHPETGAASDLFAGGKSWVDGLMTVSTPHDGSTLAYAVNGMAPWLQQAFAAIEMIFGAILDPLYDFYLDQWGVTRQPGESFSAYCARIKTNSVWQRTKDLSSWDLSPEGAQELNSWVEAQPDVYYFSWSTKSSMKDIFTGHQIPNIYMNPAWYGNTMHLGAYTGGGPGKVTVDKTWWENDGWVNVRSMNGPKIGSSDQIVTFNGTPQIGKWNHLGLKKDWDHTDIIGIGTLWPVKGFYLDQARLLGTLPQ